MFLAGGLTMKNFTGACGEKEIRLKRAIKLGAAFGHHRRAFARNWHTWHHTLVSQLRCACVSGVSACPASSAGELKNDWTLHSE